MSKVYIILRDRVAQRVVTDKDQAYTLLKTMKAEDKDRYPEDWEYTTEWAIQIVKIAEEPDVHLRWPTEDTACGVQGSWTAHMDKVTCRKCQEAPACEKVYPIKEWGGAYNIKSPARLAVSQATTTTLEGRTFSHYMHGAYPSLNFVEKGRYASAMVFRIMRQS